jgi:hypothetical protein
MGKSEQTPPNKETKFKNIMNIYFPGEGFILRKAKNEDVKLIG